MLTSWSTRRARRRVWSLIVGCIAATSAVSACTNDSTTTPTTTVAEDRQASGADNLPPIITPVGPVAWGDSTKLPPLPNVAGDGPRFPLTTGVPITPSSWVSSSLTPSLVVPNATGPWTFTIDDFSQGASGFGPKVYGESEPSTAPSR